MSHDLLVQIAYSTKLVVVPKKIKFDVSIKMFYFGMQKNNPLRLFYPYFITVLLSHEWCSSEP